MHYYQHHIGDFLKDTTNLSNEQLAVYLKMLWRYYADEKPFTDAAEDIAFAVRSDEKTVQLILRHFFVQEDDGWHQKRCDAEIDAYRKKGEKRRDAANARWANANALQVQSNSKKNHANHKPLTKNQDISPQQPDGFAEFYEAYPKKVGKPAALKAFKSAKVTSIEPLLADISARLSTGQWALTNAQYIPNPATYLNQRRWEDGVAQSQSANLWAGAI